MYKCKECATAIPRGCKYGILFRNTAYFFIEGIFKNKYEITLFSTRHVNDYGFKYYIIAIKKWIAN